MLEALRDGAKIEGVELPLDESLRNEVSYVIGALTIAPHAEAARLTADELKLKPIP